MRPVPSAPELCELQATAATPNHAYVTESTTPTPSDKVLVGAWDTGFCSCCDFCVPNFCMSLCCPWVTVAQITTRLSVLSFGKCLVCVLGIHIVAWMCFVIGYLQLDSRHEVMRVSRQGGLMYFHTPTLSAWKGYGSVWFFAGQFCLVIYAIGVWQLRTNVRKRFQIPGDCCQDLCAAVCFSWCSIAQIATHVKSYKPGSCDFQPPVDTLPPYP